MRALRALSVAHGQLRGGGGMEFIKVIFPDDCPVYIDGELNGVTNDVLRVESGTHVFTLDATIAYQPPSRTLAVDGTTVLEPLNIIFTRRRVV